MGNTDTKLSYRQAVLDLTARSASATIEPDDEDFWSRFWHDNHIDFIGDAFALISAAEIRQLRDDAPENLSTLCYKAVEQMVRVTDTLCNTASQHRTVLTCSALLTRIIPYLFEDPEWRRFFWTRLPAATGGSSDRGADGDQQPVLLAHSLSLAIADLLFCPDFTVAPLDSRGNRFGAPDTPPEDLQSIDSCEYIWEAGVGCSIGSPSSAAYDHNRAHLLRLLLTCFSESMYCTAQQVGHHPNRWIAFFASGENRHALPLFTSLLNTVFAYNPNSLVPFNHLLFTDSKEPLVEVALQILIVILDHDFSATADSAPSDVTAEAKTIGQTTSDTSPTTDNLFINYISRIHREDDFEFLLKGFTRLLNNPLQQSYLPHSTKKIQFHQELLVLFWKICDYNKKFMYYVLKTCDVLKILVPILYHLNDSRADRSRVGLVHIGVFILLLLSGERNFGVRLNRPYQAPVPMDLPIFAGTHADLLVIVFHKLITTGHQRLQPLFDCLLTILVNVSPYLKTLSMVASAKILHLLEAFSTPWFLFSNPTNHHLVFFLLEIFNNIIQYQFDGNSNLIYTIIRKRHVFHALANLPTDYGAIQRSLSQGKLSSTAAASGKRWQRTPSNNSKKSSRPKSLIETAGQSPLPGTGPSSANNFGAGGSGAYFPPPSSSSRSNPATPTTGKSFSGTPPTAAEMMMIEQPTTPHPHQHQAATSNNNGMNVSLPAMPKLEKMTERTHPTTNMDDDDDDDDNETDDHDDDGDDSQGTKPSSNRKAMSRQSSIASDGDRKSTTSTGGGGGSGGQQQTWQPTSEWIISWKQKLPLQTIMRMLQVLVPQVEKMCLDKGITDENEILKFLQHGTLVGLLPVPHPILIRKYQTNIGTTIWFRTYMWGIIYLRNSDPPIWYDTEVRLFEIQKS